MDREDRWRWQISLLAGAVVVAVVLVAVFWLGSRPKSPAAGPQKLPFGAEEQAYAQRIHFLEPQMSRAANFLNQEVTYISGQVSNDGTRSIQQMEVTLQFYDPFKQVVLRETERLPLEHAPAIAPGARRDFQISFEHVPDTWNQVYPSIRVSGLQLERSE